MSLTNSMPKAVCHWPVINPIAAAYSEVDEGYSGMCRLELDRIHCAVFPSYQIALSAAGFAINGEVGGYCNAVIKPATTTDQITHETAQEWVFG